MISVKIKNKNQVSTPSMQRFVLQLEHPLFFIAIYTMQQSNAAELEDSRSKILSLKQGDNK